MQLSGLKNNIGQLHHNQRDPKAKGPQKKCIFRRENEIISNREVHHGNFKPCLPPFQVSEWSAEAFRECVAEYYTCIARVAIASQLRASSTDQFCRYSLNISMKNSIIQSCNVYFTYCVTGDVGQNKSTLEN